MKNKTYRRTQLPSRDEFWAAAHGSACRGARQMILDILEEEIVCFLGRDRYERIGNEGFCGYRNGYGKQRQLSLGCGTTSLRAPRLRNTREPFRSHYLTAYERQSPQVKALIPDLYLHGLATGDFAMCMRALLGDAAPLSPGSVVRLKTKWQAEYEVWRKRFLADKRYVYLWVDGVYLKAGLADDKLALLVVLGVNADGAKELLALQPGYRESAESWKEVLRDLKERGLVSPAGVVGDGALGFWTAIAEVYPATVEMRCWFHKMSNVLDKVHKREQPAAKELLRAIYHASTRAEAERRIEGFAEKYEKAYPEAVHCLVKDKKPLLAYYDFPREHWKSLKTTNPIESIFAPIKTRTNAAKRIRTRATALYLVYQLVMVGQKRWHQFNGAHQLQKVLAGVQFKDGIEVKGSFDSTRKEDAA